MARSEWQPKPLFDLAIQPTQPHTNKVSCATYFPMDTTSQPDLTAYTTTGM